MKKRIEKHDTLFTEKLLNLVKLAIGVIQLYILVKGIK